MKVKIYVNWDEREIYSEKEIVAKEKKIAEQYFDDGDGFSDWLDEIFSGIELFKMNNDDKEVAKDSYRVACKEWAQESINNDFEFKEIDV